MSDGWAGRWTGRLQDNPHPSRIPFSGMPQFGEGKGLDAGGAHGAGDGRARPALTSKTDANGRDQTSAHHTSARPTPPVGGVPCQRSSLPALGAARPYHTHINTGAAAEHGPGCRAWARDALERGGGRHPPPLNSAQPMPSHCLPDGTNFNGICNRQ